MASDDVTREGYEDASRWFVSLVARVPPDAWDRPALGEWTVRELVAHTNRAHSTISEYLTEPVTSVPADYFSPEAVAARGRASVAALGDDPLAGVERASREAISLIQTTPLAQEIGTPMGRIPLGEYLPVRIAELVIHGLDLARAVDMHIDLPARSAEIALRFVGQLAVGKGVAGHVLLALSGREPLDPGFNLY